MKKLMLIFSAATLVALSQNANVNAATQVYDMTNDWSDTENPNGPWSYRGFGENGLLGNDPFPWFGGGFGWQMIGRTTQALLEFGWPLVPEYIQPGEIFVVPGYGLSVRWTAPSSGTINLSGTAWAGPDFDSFVRVAWAITHNGVPLSSGIAGGTRDLLYSFASGSGGSTALENIPVQTGDHVEIAFSSWLAARPDDPLGLTFTVSLMTDTVDPVTAIENLTLAVLEMNLQNGIENQLDSKLDAALSALNDLNVQNDGAACNSLQAFISAVEAQRGNKVTNIQADQLIASAEEVKILLNCGN
jgi:hypothetical protein